MRSGSSSLCQKCFSLLLKGLTFSFLSINYSQDFIAKVNKGNASKEEDIKKIISDKVKNDIGRPEPFISRQGFKLLRSDNVM